MEDEAEQEQEHPVRNLVLSVCDLKQHGDTPLARCASQTAMCATRMYLHGGCDEKQAYGDLHLLEIEQMRWTELKTNGAAPGARWGHTMEANNTELVLFGGLTSGGGSGSLLADEGSSRPVLPPFAAGLDWQHGGAPDNSVSRLDCSTLTWSSPACGGTPPSPRFCHSACFADELLVVFGGNGAADFSQPLGDLHWLDVRNNQWSSPSCSGEAPSARFAHKMIYSNGQLFVFGGLENAGAEKANPGVLYGYDMSNSTWSVVQVAGTAPLERSFHTFDFIGKWGFVFAGQTPNGMSDLYILDVPNMRWARPLYEGQINLRSHASAVLQDKLVVFGGVRDKVREGGRKGAPPEVESRISKKLFFLNVLEVKGNTAEGDFKFKLVTVGDSGVGKSCLLTRFVEDYYSDFHITTIGVDFKTVITMVKGRLVKLQLWDTAGQERFSVVTGNYYRNSDGFVFVYDATNRASFDHVDQWLGQVQQHHECGPGTVKILVGNKTDMIGQLQVTEEEGRAKAEAMGALFIATSAKTAANVDMAFLTAAQSLVDIRRQQKQQPTSAGSGGPAGSANRGGGSIASLGGPRPGARGSDKAKCACAGGK